MIQLVAWKTGASVRRVCEVLGEARSSFYHAGAPTVTQLANTHIGDLIEAVFRLHRRRYGSRRISEDLSDRGVTCAPLKNPPDYGPAGPAPLQPQNFVPKTSDDRADSPSPNLLSGKPMPEAPDSAWAGDIASISTGAGWLYLAVVIDLCSRRVVGWSLADPMRSDLVLDALNQALGTRSPNQTIFHSDRGSQHASAPFRKALSKAGMLQSMSARANPYDNACTESFIGTLKLEMLQAGCFENASDACVEIFDSIEG
jgi:putative transposase